MSSFKWWRRLRGGHWELWQHAFWPSSWWLKMPLDRCSAGTAADTAISGRRVCCEEYPR